MKKIFTLICAATLMGALGAGFVACKKTEPTNIERLSPLADCWVFMKTTLGNETILLAKSGLNVREANAIQDSYEAEYGKENVTSRISIPIEEGLSGFGHVEGDYNNLVDPDAVPNCYEITVTVELPDSVIPSKPAHVNGNTAICKIYLWAFTDQGSDRLIQLGEALLGPTTYWGGHCNRLFHCKKTRPGST